MPYRVEIESLPPSIPVKDVMSCWYRIGGRYCKLKPTKFVVQFREAAVERWPVCSRHAEKLAEEKSLTITEVFQRYVKNALPAGQHTGQEVEND